MRRLLPMIALAAATSPLAAASPEDKIVEVRISIAGIDLSDAAARAELEARIEQQLREACTVPAALPYASRRTTLDEDCLADARAEANAQVERAVLAQARSGRAIAAN